MPQAAETGPDEEPSTGSVHAQQPEEQLLKSGDAVGIAIRLHRLAWFRIDYLAVLQDNLGSTVIRRELQHGAQHEMKPP